MLHDHAMSHRALAPGRLALAAVLALALPHVAQAAPSSEGEAKGEAGGSVELGGGKKGRAKGKTKGNAKSDATADSGNKGDAGADAKATTEDPAKSLPWIRRYTPRRNMWEVGFFGGVWLPASNIELHDRNLPPTRLDLSSDLGLRVGYYPLRHFGLEGELAMMPTRTEAEQRAFVSTARAHVVVQLGLWRLVPFALIGGGVLSVRSEPNAAGRNGDEALHVGGGLKYFVKERIALRLEGRNIMSPKEGRTPRAPAHSPEILLGFSLALGPRKKAEAPPPDQDGDGFLDPSDLCPTDPGIAPDGCPAKDSDQDSFLDTEDVCKDEPGVAPDGCPIPDSDGDGFLDPDDACKDEAGIEPDGCPLRDVDGDGIYPPQDACVEEPETVNGFDDEDGCPDELPEEVKKYTGVIEGIYFDTGKATIRSTSYTTLDAAVKVLADYASLRVEVSGHTDIKGKRDKNLVLSRDRADSVKAYLVSKGIGEDRITTRGSGPDEPIGDNATKAGRQKNRRIEFKLLMGAAAGTVSATPSGTGAAVVACTEEAKVCADGSSVGRVAPSCEFAPCPGEVSAPPTDGGDPVMCTQEVKECADGSFVGREGPACEFKPCPGEATDAGKPKRKPKHVGAKTKAKDAGAAPTEPAKTE